MFLFSERVDSTLTRYVVVGDVVTGPLLTFQAGDIRYPYVATIVQVSDRSNAVRASTQGYELDISR